MDLLLVLKIPWLLLGLMCSAVSEGLRTGLYIHISMAVRQSSLEVIIDVISHSPYLRIDVLCIALDSSHFLDMGLLGGNWVIKMLNSKHCIQNRIY